MTSTAGRPTRPATIAPLPIRRWKPTTSAANSGTGSTSSSRARRTILTLRFGLDGDEPMTLKEVGRRLGVTREWVRKIEVRAVRKLDGNSQEPATVATKKRRRVVTTKRTAPALLACQPA